MDSSEWLLGLQEKHIKLERDTFVEFVVLSLAQCSNGLLHIGYATGELDLHEFHFRIPISWN